MKAVLGCLQSRQLAIVVASVLTAVPAACSQATDDSGSCIGGKCDEVTDDQVPESPCDGIIKDLSGAGHGKVAGRNNEFSVGACGYSAAHAGSAG